VDLSGDGKWLATGAYSYEESSVEVWSVQTGERVGVIHASSEYLSFMDEGRILAVLTTSRIPGLRTEELQFWRLSDMTLMQSVELQGVEMIPNDEHSMLRLPDGSGVLIQSRGPNRLVEANGEIVTVPTTELEIITPSPMISNLSHAVPGFFTLQWAGGRAPFQLLFRENLDESWNLIEEGIITRSVTIPLDNTKSGFYGIRSTR
jgi:hypothetical protein